MWLTRMIYIAAEIPVCLRKSRSGLHRRAVWSQCSQHSAHSGTFPHPAHPFRVFLCFFFFSAAPQPTLYSWFISDTPMLHPLQRVCVPRLMRSAWLSAAACSEWSSVRRRFCHAVAPSGEVCDNQVRQYARINGSASVHCSLPQRTHRLSCPLCRIHRSCTHTAAELVASTVASGERPTLEPRARPRRPGLRS